MVIRVQTLLNMAKKGRSVFRVRWRGWDEPKKWDTDGIDGEPDTWARWEEDYFSSWAYARQAADPTVDGWGRRGVMDQVKAGVVLAQWQRAGVDLSPWFNGRHRLVYSMVVRNIAVQQVG